PDDRAFRLSPEPRQHLVERRALDELHGEEEPALEHSRVVHLHDARVIERLPRGDLVLEALRGDGARVAVEDELQGDDARIAVLARAVDGAHSAARDLAEDLVGTEARSDRARRDADGVVEAETWTAHGRRRRVDVLVRIDEGDVALRSRLHATESSSARLVSGTLRARRYGSKGRGTDDEEDVGEVGVPAVRLPERRRRHG